MGDNKESKILGQYNSAFMGISYASRVFTKELLARVIRWLRSNGIKRLEIIICDEIEAINYEVFRGLPSREARNVARRRGEELRRMVEAVFGAENIEHSILLESAFTKGKEFRQVYSEIIRAYAGESSFRRDVQRQVLHNLKFRVAQLGEKFIEARIDKLANYVLGEIALIEAYRRLKPRAIEIYPGPNLRVKERMWRGLYHKLVTFALREGDRPFVDISFLAAARSAA